MVDGNELMLNQLTIKYKILNNSFCNNNLENMIIALKEYLFEVFPTREKLGEKHENNIEFKAIKKLYNLFKHACDFNLLLQVHLLIPNRSYPYQYPYRYGKAGVKFGDFSEVYKSTTYEAIKKEKDMVLCNNILKNKEPNLIIEKLHNDTVSKLLQFKV